jgi:hypothetical protein
LRRYCLSRTLNAVCGRVPAANAASVNRLCPTDEKVSGDHDQLSAAFAGPSHDAVREHQSKRCGKISEKKKDEHYLFLDPPGIK